LPFETIVFIRTAGTGTKEIAMEYRHPATVLERRRSFKKPSNGVGRKKKAKSLLHKVGHQIRKVGRGKNHEEYFSDDHNQNSAVIEYSLSQYQKNVSDYGRQNLRLQKKLQKKQLHKQGRDDDELLHSSVVADEIRSNSATNDGATNNDNKSGADSFVEVAESYMNPLSWVYSLTSPTSLKEDNIDERETENEDDRREFDAEGDDGYQADQEREQNSRHKENEVMDRVFKRRLNRYNTETSSKIAGGKTAQETNRIARRAPNKPASMRARSFMKSAKRASRSSGEMVSQQSRSLMISASKSASRSSRAIVSGAKMVTRVPVNMVRTSSKVIVSNAKKASKSTGMIAARSSKAITHGAQMSSQALAHSIQKTSDTSKALASSIKCMVDANQKKAASALLVSVHAMIAKSAQYKSPGALLDSIQALIRDSEKKVAKSRRVSCRERRRSYHQSKGGLLAIDQQKSTRNVEKDNSAEVKKRYLEAIRADTMVPVNLPLVRSVSDDRTENSDVIDVYRSEYDNETEDENYSDYNVGTDTDWDDHSRNSETSANTTDFNDYDDSNYLDEESDIETGVASFTDYDISDDGYTTGGYTTGASACIEDDETLNAEYLYTHPDLIIEESDDDDDDDDVDNASCLLSDRDQEILNGIEDDLEQLEGMHENEKFGWLYRTFFPED